MIPPVPVVAFCLAAAASSLTTIRFDSRIFAPANLWKYFTHVRHTCQQRTSPYIPIPLHTPGGKPRGQNGVSFLQKRPAGRLHSEWSSRVFDLYWDDAWQYLFYLLFSSHLRICTSHSFFLLRASLSVVIHAGTLPLPIFTLPRHISRRCR